MSLPGYAIPGSSGLSLSQTHKARWSDDLLRDFAVQTLGAKRCSVQYLETLRCVLGNMAEADRLGCVLWLSRRSADRLDAGSARTLRTISEQFIKAGICHLMHLRRGGFVSLTAAYRGDSVRLTDAAEELERVQRSQEEKDAASMWYWPEAVDVGVLAEEVPH
jgi:hypothetical protein